MAVYCLLNEERRFIFCVDPKCGCTTIKNWFIRILDKPNSKKPIKIATWMVPANSVGSLDDYLKIWFVRDPFRRLVSFYYQFVVKQPKHWNFADHNKQETLADSTFQEFIQIVGDLHDRGERLQHHLQLQTRTLLEVDFDAIVKIENLENRKKELMAMIDVDVEPQHYNRQKKTDEIMQNAYLLTPEELKKAPVYDYSSFWNNDLLATVERVYAKDCEFYRSL